MKRAKYLLFNMISSCMLLVGCSANDMSQDGLEQLQSSQHRQETIENPQDGQELMQSPQDGQEPMQSPQDGQELMQSPQDGQEQPQNPQGVQEMLQNPQDGQEQLQTPQVQTEGLTEARNLLYEDFLKNETSVTNPYVEGMNLTVMDDKGYESEFEDAQKKYAYVDVNGDEYPELIFKISSAPSELMYILGIYDNELVCFDVFETHTKNIDFGVYDYGLVWEDQNYDGFEMIFYTYTTDGQPMEVRRFSEENVADIAAYEGEEPEWMDWQYDGNDGNLSDE